MSNKVQINSNIEIEIYRFIAEKAKREFLSISSVVRQIIMQWHQQEIKKGKE